MKKYIQVGKEKLGRAMSTVVLLRALGEKELLATWELYKQNRHHGSVKEPTPLQYKLAEAKKKGESGPDIAKKFSVESHHVYEAIKRVAMWNYLKD